MTSAPSFLTLHQRFRDNTIAHLLAFKWQLLCELRVAVPGIIESFNAEKQTAEVQVAITENMISPKTLSAEPVKIPLLSDVPVIMFRAGNFVLTFPVKKGDECLLIFGDNDYGAWWEAGAKDAQGKQVIQNQVDRRRHDLSDSFAIVGLWSQPNKISNYSEDAVQLRTLDGEKIVEVTDTEINIRTTDSGDINVEAAGSGNVSVNSTQEVDVNAPTVKIAGSSSVQISGGHTTIDGKNFLTHTHGDPQGGVTGSVT